MKRFLIPIAAFLMGSILNRSTNLTLTIINVDAPIRIFEWKLK